MQQLPEDAKSNKNNTEIIIYNENINWFKEKIKAQPVLQDKDIEQTETRRQLLLTLSDYLIELSTLIIENYIKLMDKNSLKFEKISLYMIGGRVRNEPIKDTSDIDFFITSENQLPINIEEEIKSTIHQSFDSFLKSKGFKGSEEIWLLEMKKFGTNTEAELLDNDQTLMSQGGKMVIKIAQKIA